MGLLDFLSKKQLPTGRPIFGSFSGSAAPDMKGSEFLAAYQSWAYTAVNAIADDVASMDIVLQKKTKDGWDTVEDHMALQTLNYVNEFMSSTDLLYATQGYLELDGNAFWWLPPGRMVKKPIEIWALDPTRTTVVRSDRSFIGGYVYHNEQGKDIPLSVDQVIHFKRFNPRNPYRGMGTIQAAALAIDTDKYSATWNRNFFFNSGMPSGVLETDGSLSEEAFSRLKAQWDSRYSGIDNAHKTALLTNGLKYKPVSLSQKDMDFLGQRKFSQDEILAMFRVPKALLGLAEDFNRANIEGIEYIFSKRVIKPKMLFILDRLTEFYLPLFGLNLKTQEYRFGLATDPVPQNAELEIKKRESGIKYGYLLRNEVRSEDGRDELDGGDEALLASDLKPWSIASQPQQPPPAAPAPPATDDDKDEAKAVTKQVSLVNKGQSFIDSQIATCHTDILTIYTKQKKSLLKKLTGKKSITKADDGEELVRLLFDKWDDWIGILLNPVEGNMKEALAEAGKLAIAEVGVSIDFDLLNPRVLDFLSENALAHATSINETIKDALAIKIMEGVEQGLGAQDIADSISGFFDDQADWRALRVARSEVMTGYGQGTLEGYRQSDVVKLKSWLTAGDEKVDGGNFSGPCVTNESAGAIPLEQAFPSGNLAPIAHPNCRCSLVPVV